MCPAAGASTVGRPEPVPGPLRFPWSAMVPVVRPTPSAVPGTAPAPALVLVLGRRPGGAWEGVRADVDRPYGPVGRDRGPNRRTALSPASPVPSLPGGLGLPAFPRAPPPGPPGAVPSPGSAGTPRWLTAIPCGFWLGSWARSGVRGRRRAPRLGPVGRGGRPGADVLGGRGRPSRGSASGTAGGTAPRTAGSGWPGGSSRARGTRRSGSAAPLTRRSRRRFARPFLTPPVGGPRSRLPGRGRSRTTGRCSWPAPCC